MLQLDVYHGEKVCYIASIRENGELLAEFDHKVKTIDLSVLCGKEGSELSVRHYNIDSGKPVLDYEADKVLGKVDKDDNGIWYIEY